MTVTVYDSPGTEDYRSSQFAATVNATTAYVYGFSRTTQFGGLTGGLQKTIAEWAENEVVEVSILTVAAEEGDTVTVTVSRIGADIESARVFPEVLEIPWVISDGDLVITLTVGQQVRVEVNDEPGEALYVSCSEPIPTPTGTDYNTSMTSLSGTVIFRAGAVYDLAGAGAWADMLMPVDPLTTVHIEGGAVVIGSFDMRSVSACTFQGHGVVLGDYATAEDARAGETTFESKLPFAMFLGTGGVTASHSHTFNGLTFARYPFYPHANCGSTFTWCKFISPWYGECGGPSWVPNGTTHAVLVEDCIMCCADDVLQVAPVPEGYTVTFRRTLAVIVQSDLIAGSYRGGDDPTLTGTTQVLDTYVRSFCHYRVTPAFDDGNYRWLEFVTGTLIRGWLDGAPDQLDDWGVFNLTIDGFTIEGDECVENLLDFKNTQYPWLGAGTTPQESGLRGSIGNVVIRNLTMPAFSDTALGSNLINGLDKRNTPHDISFENVRIDGELLTARNFLDFFSVGWAPYAITVGGQTVVTSVDLCNKALALLGDDALVTSISPSDGSRQAELCQMLFAGAISTVMELAGYAIAKKRIQLTEVEDGGNDQWPYCYEIPEGMMCAIKVLPDGAQDDYVDGHGDPVPFVQELDADGNLRLYTNVEDAWLVYTVYLTAVSGLGPNLQEAIAYQLASELAGPLMKGEAGAMMSERCLKKAAFYASKASAVDGNQSPTRPLPAPPWITARG